jgi:hypothetical protein
MTKYELPNQTLQLIAGSPELSVPMMRQGGSSRTDLISALRNISGPTNPGFTRFANNPNGAALNSTKRNYRGANNPGLLSMGKYVAPEVVLPGGETRTPYVRPDDLVSNDLVFNDVVNDDVVDDDVVDDDVVDDDVVDDDVVDDDVVDDVVDDDVVDDDVVDDDVVDDDVVDDDGWIDPTEFDPVDLDELVIPEITQDEKTGTVTIEDVDPNEESPQDDGTTADILDLINEGLPTPFDDVDVGEPRDDGTTDDILDLINSDYFNDLMDYSVDGYPGGIPGYEGYEQYGGGFGGGGGGKPGDDNLWQIMAM